MLQIRQDQMETLNDYMRQTFERRMQAQMADQFPKECEALGETHLAELITTAIEHAAEYQIITEGDVERYIILCFKLTPTFDENLPWAEEILNRDGMDGPERLQALYAHAEQEGLLKD